MQTRITACSRSIRVCAITLVLTAVGMCGIAAAQTWTDQDVGNVGLGGDHSVSTGVWTVRGAGADIWGTADAFHFVYQQLSGDYNGTAKLDNKSNYVIDGMDNNDPSSNTRHKANKCRFILIGLPFGTSDKAGKR